MENSDEECEAEGVLHGKTINSVSNTLSDEDWDGSDETISPGSAHAVGLGINADRIGNVVGDMAIPGAAERERADEMGGCPFSGLMVVEAQHSMPRESSNAEAK